MGRLGGSVHISGPDLSLAGGLAGIDRLPVQPFRLLADVEQVGGALRIGNGLLTLPDSRMELRGSIAQVDALAGKDLAFRFKGADLGRFREAFGLPAAVTGAFDISGSVQAGDAGDLLDGQVTTELGKLGLKGTLGAAPGFHGTRLDVVASGKSLARLGPLLGTTLPAVRFSATGDVEWTADGTVIHHGDLRAGRDEIQARGRVARNPLGPGTDVTWRVRGPDLARFAAPWEVDGLPAGPFDVRGRLRRAPGVSRLDEVRGRVAGADVRLSGRIADEPRNGTTLQFSIDGPALQAFAGMAGAYPLPAGPFRLAGGVALGPERIRFNRLKVSAGAAQGTIDADVELPLGVARGQFAVVARGKDVARWLPRLGAAGTAAVPFDLRLRGESRNGAWRLDEARFDTPRASLAASGRLDWAPDFSATALRVSVQAPDLAAAGRLFGLKLPAVPLDLGAEFSGTPTAFTAQRASGRVGRSDFEGRVNIDLRQRPVVDLAFHSGLLDLAALGLDRTEPAAVAAHGPPTRRKDARLIPDTPISLAWLGPVDGSLALTADRVLFANLALDDLRLDAHVEAGDLTVEALELKAPPDGRLSISGELKQGPRGAVMRVAVRGTRVLLAREADSPAERQARPRAEIALDLSGEGGTWRALAAALDGKLAVTTGAGAMPSSSLNALLGGLWRDLAAAVMPGVTARESTSVRCLAAFASVTDGTVVTAPALVMQTDQVNLIAHGTVQLATEEIGFYLNTAPRRGRVDVSVAEIVNPYMKVTGSLAHPGIGVDPKGVLFTGGAAVATAGISILAKGVWDRIFRAADPCAEAAAEARRGGEGTATRRKSLLPRRRAR